MSATSSRSRTRSSRKAPRPTTSAYIGDARIGAGANIGAGTITCNYDGVFKHRTEIGAGAFIGSNTALVAPVSDRRTARWSPRARSSPTTCPTGALAIARGRQEVQARRSGSG